MTAAAHADAASVAPGNDPVFYHIGVESPITPQTPLPPLPAIPPGALVVVEGRAPIWRYGMAQHRLHGSAAGATAFYDPKLGGAVVVASHRPEYREGEVIALPLPADPAPPGTVEAGQS